MSRGSVLNDALAASDTSQPDRRQYPRYPIALELRYKLLNQDPAQKPRSGRTLSISNGGISFDTKDQLPEGSQIDLAIDWPYLLNGASRLRLVVHGHVVRGDTKGAVVKVSRYEFRTSTAAART
jgi:c-di-GMP-binding flagellar brake protein YcgR